MSGQIDSQFFKDAAEYLNNYRNLYDFRVVDLLSSGAIESIPSEVAFHFLGSSKQNRPTFQWKESLRGLSQSQLRNLPVAGEADEVGSRSRTNSATHSQLQSLPSSLRAFIAESRRLTLTQHQPDTLSAPTLNWSAADRRGINRCVEVSLFQLSQLLISSTCPGRSSTKSKRLVPLAAELAKRHGCTRVIDLGSGLVSSRLSLDRGLVFVGTFRDPEGVHKHSD